MFTSDQDDDAKDRHCVNIHCYPRGKIYLNTFQCILLDIHVSVSLRDLVLTRGPDDHAQGARGARGQGPDGPGHLHLHPRLLSRHLDPLHPPETALLLAARQLVQGEHQDGQIYKITIYVRWMFWTACLRKRMQSVNH